MSEREVTRSSKALVKGDFGAVADRALLDARGEEFDRFDMARVIERLPLQIEMALQADLPQMPQGPFDQVVLAGMGGSALPMDIVTDCFRDRLRVPVIVSRHYNLHTSVDCRTLAIVSSFSGNTEEALSAFDLLRDRAACVVVLTGGGPLARRGRDAGLPVIEIPVGLEPDGFQPRSAIGYSVTYLLRALYGAGLVEDPRDELSCVSSFLPALDLRSDAEELAVWLQGRIPVVYTDETHFHSIARITKIKFNENAKVPAFCNALPELNHNEMVGFTTPVGRYGILYLHDPHSHPRIRRRFEVMKRLFEQEQFEHVECRSWDLPGDTALQKIFASVLLAEWCSYTLALLGGVDPTPVDLVERFKQALK
jgi:glucose/mannose-6-phosphate isomerase